MKICPSCQKPIPRTASHYARAMFCSHKCRGDAAVTHGHARNGMTATYRIWAGMLSRCENQKATHYQYYGGRGIKVCERWHSFECFLTDVGERPSQGHSLDRYPNADGNYEVGNVRWATLAEQGRNRRSNRAVIRGDGKRFASIVEAAESIADGNANNIWSVCNGGRKRHRGFTWQYANPELEDA